MMLSLWIQSVQLSYKYKYTFMFLKIFVNINKNMDGRKVMDGKLYKSASLNVYLTANSPGESFF